MSDDEVNPIGSMEELETQVGAEWADVVDQGVSNLATVGSMQVLNDAAVMGKTLPMHDIDAVDGEKASIVVAWVRVEPDQVEEKAEEIGSAINEALQ